MKVEINVLNCSYLILQACHDIDRQESATDIHQLNNSVIISQIGNNIFILISLFAGDNGLDSSLPCRCEGQIHTR